LGRSVKQKGSSLLRPLRLSQICIGKDNVALLGEAAGWISPSSAEGLSYALRSAVMLAGALAPGPDDFVKRYRRNARRLRANIWLKNLKGHFIYDPWLRRIVMESGITSLELARC